MLRLSHINKSFNVGTVDEKQLFKDFNIEISKGEFVSVIGSNGSGKTTMLNIISGDIKPDSGDVFLSGDNITKMANYKRARRISRVFQNPSNGTCPTMTILENMTIADNKGKSFNITKGLNNKRKDFYRSSIEKIGMGIEKSIGNMKGCFLGG